MDFDVAVLGYGPVGHVMAALLGQAGWRVGVFERQLGLYPLPRIGHLDHEVMRIVQAVGVASEFERDACVCKTYDWVNAAGQVLIHFDWSKPEITGWSPHYLFYQPDLDKLLAASVEKHPNVQVFRGWECKSITALPPFWCSGIEPGGAKCQMLLAPQRFEAPPCPAPSCR